MVGSTSRFQLSAIGASERQRNGGYASNFAEFKAKLEGADLGAVQLLKPRGYWGITFYDFCLCASQADLLEQKIHEILFPDKEFLWLDYAYARGLPPENLDQRWRNAKCDVLALWCHIHYDGDVFVTSDKNFHAQTKIDKLQALGSGKILFPKDALALATASLAGSTSG